MTITIFVILKMEHLGNKSYVTVTLDKNEAEKLVFENPTYVIRHEVRHYNDKASKSI